MNPPTQPATLSDEGSYFGGKGGPGVYQRLINEIPPHDVLIVPFAGRCAVTRHMAPPDRITLCDRDAEVIRWWQNREKNALRVFGEYPNIQVMFWDGLSLLEDPIRWLKTPVQQQPRVFIYCDPPYPAETLKSESRYRFLLTSEEHDKLLKLLQSLNAVPCDRRPKIMISSYWSQRYVDALHDWRTFSFQAMTQRGPAIEHVWCNYQQPTELHDYQFLGKDKVERFKLDRRRENLLAKLRRLPAIERNALLAAVASEFGVAGSSGIVSEFKKGNSNADPITSEE
jgi:hypothetical protein